MVINEELLDSAALHALGQVRWAANWLMYNACLERLNRYTNYPEQAGVFCITDNTRRLFYVGESDNIRRSVLGIINGRSSAFRKSFVQTCLTGISGHYLAAEKLNGPMEEYIDTAIGKLYVVWQEIPLGRLEVKEYLVSHYMPLLMKSKSPLRTTPIGSHMPPADL